MMILQDQLDLFSGPAVRLGQSVPREPRHMLRLGEISDGDLITAIPDAEFPEAGELAAEAGRRQLVAAVQALAALCRRFAGFGARRTLPEQAAALDALVMIGGPEAAAAVADMIHRGIVEGPGLRIAARAAADLGSIISTTALRQLLRHDEPAVRAAACRCVRPLPELIALVIELLDDLDQAVATAAACALGRMGRIEARSKLKALLSSHPCKDVIDAVSSVADDECMVLLGRIARSGSALAEAALESLESIGLPRAAAIAAGIRRLRMAQ
jgi:hypothetical protein